MPLGVCAEACPSGTRSTCAAAAGSGRCSREPTSSTRTTAAQGFRPAGGRLRGRTCCTRCTACRRRSPRLGRPDAPPGRLARRLVWLGTATPLETLLTRSATSSRPRSDRALPRRARLLAEAPPRDPARHRAWTTRASGGHGVLVAGVPPTSSTGRGSTSCSPRCALADAPARLEVFGDGSLREELERQAREAGVDALFHGFVPDVRDRLAAPTCSSCRHGRQPADVDPRGDGLRTAGRRHAVGGIPELVTDGETGLLVAPEILRALRRRSSSSAKAGAARVVRRAGRRTRQRGVLDRGRRQADRRVYEEMCASST